MRGFTLIEIVVVIAVMAALIGALVPLSARFKRQNDIQVVAETYAQALRRAQVLSQSMSGDSAWGVIAATGTVTLFKGSAYAARVAGYDELYPFATQFAATGTTEFDFAKFTGLPAAAGTTTFSFTGAASRSVYLNAKGIPTY